jgi:AcrR family transcriptional regulator
MSRPAAAGRTPRAKAKTTSEGRTPRLSIEDWVNQALKLLMDEGVQAVKITRLCSELEVTKGSFYWHFADIDDLMEAITTHWCDLTRETLRNLSELDHLPPVERLQRMTNRLIDDRFWAVERALREWARTDERVATAVTESDQFVFELVQQALRELGFDARQARLRAGLLVYAGIGFAHGQQSLPKPTPADIDDLLHLLAPSATR